MVSVHIVNVVATASLEQKVDFSRITQAKEVLYDSDVYGGSVAYFKTSKMKGRVSIFSSGKLISVGTTSEETAFKELELAMESLSQARLIKKTKIVPKIQNIVASADFGLSVNLEKLSENMRAIYEPEQFPGAILRINKPNKACVLVFASGKAVITGFKESVQLQFIVQELKQTMESNQ